MWCERVKIPTFPLKRMCFYCSSQVDCTFEKGAFLHAGNRQFRQQTVKSVVQLSPRARPQQVSHLKAACEDPSQTTVLVMADETCQKARGAGRDAPSVFVQRRPNLPPQHGEVRAATVYAALLCSALSDLRDRFRRPALLSVVAGLSCAVGSRNKSRVSCS